MKLKGQTIGRPSSKPVVFTRGDTEFVFHVQAVFDLEKFEEMCPEPKPKRSLKKGLMIDDAYKKAREDWFKLRATFVILQSLDATEDLEWEQVDRNDPSTWANYEKELREAGLTTGELTYLIEQVNSVNSITEKVMEEARDRFIASQEAEGLLQ